MSVERTDIQITTQTLQPEACRQWVTDERTGGVVLFVGTVRNHTDNKEVVRLDFEAYLPMAHRELDKIAEEMGRRWPVRAVSIHHRIGSLSIGEIAVVIGVGAAHRTAAFAACQYAIDTLKQTVPIWKKEIFADGAVWVSAHP